MEAAESLRFYNPQLESDPNTTVTLTKHQREGTQERYEDIGFNNPSNDPNTLQRVGPGRTSSSQDSGEE
jgi:Cft2 family RNA processing exonuclease